MFASPSGNLCSPLKLPERQGHFSSPLVKAMGYIGNQTFGWPHKACLNNFDESRDTGQCEGEVQCRRRIFAQPQQF